MCWCFRRKSSAPELPLAKPPFVAATEWVEEFRKTHTAFREGVYNYLTGLHMLCDGAIECKLNPNETYLQVRSTKHPERVLATICVTDDQSIADGSTLVRQEENAGYPEVSRTGIESNMSC